MPTPFSGGCRCGAVRYECSAEPMATMNCHCRDCQYATGGAYATIFLVPKPALTVRGTIKGYAVQAESGNTVTRSFCPECGTPMFSTLSANDQLMVVKAASLDDPSWLKPAMHIWTHSAQPWAETSAELPRFDRAPTR